MQTTTNSSGSKSLAHLYQNIQNAYPALSRNLVKTPIVEFPWAALTTEGYGRS